MSEDVERVLKEHVVSPATGGTATGSTWRCSCGASATVNGVRSWADEEGRAHLAGVILAAMTPTPLEWGCGNDMAISLGIDRAGSEREVKEWNDRAAILTREARGEASYPRAFLYARTPAVPAGKWEPTQ